MEGLSTLSGAVILNLFQDLGLVEPWLRRQYEPSFNLGRTVAWIVIQKKGKNHLSKKSIFVMVTLTDMVLQSEILKQVQDDAPGQGTATRNIHSAALCENSLRFSALCFNKSIVERNKKQERKQGTILIKSAI